MRIYNNKSKIYLKIRFLKINYKKLLILIKDKRIFYLCMKVMIQLIFQLKILIIKKISTKSFSEKFDFY